MRIMIFSLVNKSFNLPPFLTINEQSCNVFIVKKRPISLWLVEFQNILNFYIPKIFQGMCYNCVTVVNCYWDNLAIICPWELYITKKTVAKLKHHALITRLNNLQFFWQLFSSISTDTCQTFASCNTEMSIPYNYQ